MELLNISSNLKRISWLIYNHTSQETIHELVEDSKDRLAKIEGFEKLKLFLENPSLDDAESFLTWAMILQHKAGF